MNINLNSKTKINQVYLRKNHYSNQNTLNSQNLSFGGYKQSSTIVSGLAIMGVMGINMVVQEGMDKLFKKNDTVAEQIKKSLPELQDNLRKNGARATFENISGRIIVKCGQSLNKLK